MSVQEVIDIVKRAYDTCDVPFFRGHQDEAWQLLPGLARAKAAPSAEQLMYYDFTTRAGTLLSPDRSGWSHLFSMQHHGLPTRLLDWTTTFGVALYFAVKAGGGDAAVWVLDPYELNKHTDLALPTPEELNASYYDTFIDGRKTFEGRIVALQPPRFHPRVHSQHAAFTFHAYLEEPLEAVYRAALRKIVIPAAAREHAQLFLRLAGISEFSLFPDLDGLARDLNSLHYLRPL